MQHIVKTTAGTWYTITCTAPATVTETIQGEIAPLATLEQPGTEKLRASGTSITVETEGRVRILPFD